MNRGIYVAPSPHPHLTAARQGDVDLCLQAPTADVDWIEKVIRKSQSADNVRSLDPHCPASSIARATRLSQLYGVSLTTKLARKGAGERPGRRRYQQPRQYLTAGRSSGSPGSSRERDEGGGPKKKTAIIRQRRTLRSALNKAGEVALRLTLEASAGVKAFDGPPLSPRDVKDLFLRNFRVRLSTSEAEALIVNFTTTGHRPPDRAHFSTIEHGEFLQALRRLRRELLKKPKGNTSGKTNDGQRSLVGGCGPESSTSTTSSSLPTLSLRRNYSGTTSRESDRRQSIDASVVARALAKVDRAASSYDSRRVENLRQADLSRVTSPRTFGGVLLARFDVRVDPLEQNELVSLLQDENGTVDIERFRTYFLGLIGEYSPAPEKHKNSSSLPPLKGSNGKVRAHRQGRNVDLQQRIEGPYR